MAIFAGRKIDAFVGPRELGAVDDLETVAVEIIDGARESLDIAVQELDSEPIAQAILDARFPGVSVRMVLEQDYLRTAKLPRITVRRGEPEADARRSTTTRTSWSSAARTPTCPAGRAARPTWTGAPRSPPFPGPR